MGDRGSAAGEIGDTVVAFADFFVDASAIDDWRQCFLQGPLATSSQVLAWLGGSFYRINCEVSLPCVLASSHASHRANSLPLYVTELDARMHYIETLRQSVIAPLSLYRDAQERIRKRVKDDLKTSISAYDDMRHHTLPRAKKAYDKKCEELEQVRLHQQAIEDQKALLSQSNLQRTPSRQESSGEAFSPTSSAPSEPDEERNQSEPETAVTSPRRSSSLRAKRKTRRGGSDGSDLSGSRQQAASESASPRLGGEASLGASPPSHASGDRKGHFLDALRSREHWEAARKEAPKKINALISRMREGGSSDKSDAGVYAASPDSGSGATSLGMSLGAGPGSLRSNQNMALRHVKAKRESEE